jgi:FkbM family methyltransferase
MSVPIYENIETRYGRFLVNPRDKYIGRSLIAYGEWGEAEVRLFEQIVRPGDTIVEVGANIGSHTVPLSKLTGPTGKLHAFEPQRLINQLLNANLALNECLNAHVHRAAISDTVGFAEICSIPPQHETNYGAISLGLEFGVDSTMERVPVQTIDALDLNRLDFLKVDAEGHDVQVLKGATASLEKHRPAVFVEVNGETGDILTALLRAIDYECWWYNTKLFDAANFRENENNIWSDHGYELMSADILALPRDKGWKVEGLDPVRPVIEWDRLRVSADNFRTELRISRD